MVCWIARGLRERGHDVVAAMRDCVLSRHSLRGDPLAAVLRRADEVPHAGHRVFAVTADPLFYDPPSIPETPRMPDPRWGWHAGSHFHVGALPFGDFLQTPAARWKRIAVPQDAEVSPYERMLLFETRGYIACAAHGGFR